jgi:hypothetical protein
LHLLICRLAVVACLCAAAPTPRAGVNDAAALEERLAVFGQGFLIDRLAGRRLENPAEWIGRPYGEYRYRFVVGSDDGAQTHIERHVPDPEDPARGWQRIIGDRIVEVFVNTDDGELMTIHEIDRKHGFRVHIDPGVRWPPGVEPGDVWRSQASLAVYRTKSDEVYRRGTLDSTLTYEGMYRVRTPAGEFDTILLREDFVIHVGPMKAEDDRWLFFARGVGLVAEIEGIRATAAMLLHYKDDAAKVLEAPPD